MSESKPHKFDLYVFTRQTIAKLLDTKGQVLNLKSFTHLDQVEGFNLLKVYSVLRAAGFVYFLNEVELVYIGTSRSVLKFFKFAIDKVARAEPEPAVKKEESDSSERGYQENPFRSPKDFRSVMGQTLQIGNWEFSAFEFRLLEDFCEQIIMEMLFDASGVTRQIHKQVVRDRPPGQVQGRSGGKSVPTFHRWHQNFNRPKLRKFTSSKSPKTVPP